MSQTPMYTEADAYTAADMRKAFVEGAAYQWAQGSCSTEMGAEREAAYRWPGPLTWVKLTGITEVARLPDGTWRGRRPDSLTGWPADFTDDSVRALAPLLPPFSPLVRR